MTTHYTAPAPDPSTAGPRYPMTPTEFCEIAAALQARRRSRLTRLSPPGRLRKWGDA